MDTEQKTAYELILATLRTTPDRSQARNYINGSIFTAHIEKREKIMILL